MLFASIIHDYFVWHYSQAWWQMWGIWRNFMWLSIHYFSLPQLTRTLFDPFKRTTEGRGDKFSLEDLASYIIINTLSRLIGAITRLTLIIIGCAGLLLVIVTGFVVYLFWMIAPFLIIGLLGASVSLFLI